MNTITRSDLLTLFQSKFNLPRWCEILKDNFRVSEIKVVPEKILNYTFSDDGYYLGLLNTSDSFRIGLFLFNIQRGSVNNKKVGLRNLVKSFVNPRWGEFDAALVVFDDSDKWRLSFVCDIKGEATAPKRYTYVFGDSDNYYNTPIGRFETLFSQDITFNNIKEAFSVEALTKQFYNDLFEWYQWVISADAGITFPNNTTIEDDDRENIDIKIIRLITRLMFVWFIKQKGLIPDKIFNVRYLKTIIKDFDPQSKESGEYYNAILQNLFFATLNRAIVDENGNKRGFAERLNKTDLKTLYRYDELFLIGKNDIVQLFSEVPFLNGGLFECLDKTKTIHGVEHAFYFDGFSRNNRTFPNGRYKYRATIPNDLFFKPEKGLFEILSRYNFTIEENTPNEQQVALDPELLGKVFENLLGAYNPETKETARNQSGSFYTPREVVNYMVDESLIAYLGGSDIVRSLFRDDFEKKVSDEDEYKRIATAIGNIKILDPACGSGAFPMGLLNRMVDILQKIQPELSTYSLKLRIIEKCIYGCDIQSIAAQITKLRFFISLICDCQKDEAKPNFGIPTLPNLETKFVAANSLIAKKKKAEGGLFEDPEIEPTKQELAKVRHDHFLAKTTNEKIRLRGKDQQLREKLVSLLSSSFDVPEDATQLAKWNPYDQNEVASFFDKEWMFGVKEGFDIIIGNPPYIQLQRATGQKIIDRRGNEVDQKYGDIYQNEGYTTFERTGDMYCLFYERGCQLLKPKGHLCYITSNKWMRAGYGESMRGYFAKNTNPELLIDFGGVKIFESATVDTNIILVGKEENKHKTLCSVTSKLKNNCINNLSDFVGQNHSIIGFKGSDSWVILSPIELSIKHKIESVGTPLKDWDINIYRGILTGCNEAFIISTEKRKEIIANCSSEEEKKRTEELIRPILRGRDIKRYGYDWANLWLINTHNGIKGKLPRIKIEDYPAVKAHLDQYWEQIRDRADQGDTPYNLRNCAYLEDFSKPKIIYPNMTKYLPFVYDERLFLTNQKCFIIISSHVAFLTAFFNSSLFKYCFRDSFPELQGGTRELSKIFFDKIPVKNVSDAENEEFKTVINNIQSDYTKEQAIVIDKMLFRLYNLTEDEQKVIGYIEIS